MNKITAEEAKKALQRLSSIAYMNLEDTLLLDEYIYQKNYCSNCGKEVEWSDDD